MSENKNVYALVTGASSGMGLEYAKNLAERGYNLILVALFQNEMDAVKDSLSKDYPDLDILSLGIDLSAVDAAEKVYGYVAEQRPEAQVEVLVNNAGLLGAMHFRNMTPTAVSRIIMVHCHAEAMLCNYFMPAMMERGKGYVLNISSLAAWFPYPFLTMYASTKAFVKVFTRALRTECSKTGVKVASIYFGAVDTPLFKLSPSLRKLARNIGVMITPQKAASMALKMLFKGRSGKIPGFVNKLAYVATPLLRPSLIAAIDRWATRRWNLK